MTTTGSRAIKLPSCMMRGFTIMPLLKVTNLENFTFEWYRAIRDRSKRQPVYNLLKLADGLTYCPTDEDVGHHLKVVCRPCDDSKDRSICTHLSGGPVEVGPTKCPFELRHMHTKNLISEPNTFRFLTYNILADLYADSAYSRSVLFSHCPSHALKLDYRRQLLLKEIVGYNSDIICLQEVDKKEFIRTFEPYFRIIEGFYGLYGPKGGKVAEGTATFYRTTKFELVNSHRLVLSELIESKMTSEDTKGDCGKNGDRNAEPESEPNPILKDRDSPLAQKCLSYFDQIRSVVLSNEKLKQRFVNRNNSLQVSLLKSKISAGRYIIVATTHLYFSPDADHVRLLQGCVCVKYLEFIKDFYKQQLIESGEKSEAVDIGIIFCGDMNSTPDSGIYKLMHEGKVGQDLPDWVSNQEEAVVGLEVDTNLRFSSAYENVPYTNYTPVFNGCLDYIYFERDKFNCVGTIPLPDHSVVTEVGGIPSDVFPSDHLALIANLKHS